MILAQISAPTPNCGQPPSTVTRWLVLITLVSMLSTSKGRMVRRLITWHTEDRQTGIVNRPLSAGHLCQVSSRCVPSLYLALNSFLGKDGSSVQAKTYIARVGNHGDVSPWSTKRRKIYESDGWLWVRNQTFRSPQYPIQPHLPVYIYLLLKV